jgi:NAD(P)-dependent dehydrogenase (short-subunit alcohol dehydrogenase family)
MEKSLNQERVVLVTGVSSGIGQATACMLAGRGFRVFGTLRRPIESDTIVEAVELLN